METDCKTTTSLLPKQLAAFSCPLDLLGRCRPVHCVCHSSNKFSVWFSRGPFLFYTCNKVGTSPSLGSIRGRTESIGCALYQVELLDKIQEPDHIFILGKQQILLSISMSHASIWDILIQEKYWLFIWNSNVTGILYFYFLILTHSLPPKKASSQFIFSSKSNSSIDLSSKSR